MPTKEELHAAFVAELLSEVPADMREGVRASLEGSKKLKDGVLRQDEFSRSMDQVKADRDKLALETQQAASTIAGWQDWYKTTSAEQTTLQDTLTKYEQAYGKLDASTADAVAKGTITQVQLDDILAKRGQDFLNSSLNASERIMNLKLRHFGTYPGEILSSEDLLKIANEKGVPVEVAYDFMTADKRAAKAEADITARVDAAREEGRKAALSSAGLPLAQGAGFGGFTGNSAVAFINSKIPGVTNTSPSRIDAAVAQLNERLAARS